jgi:hypothetical protein
VSSDLNFARSAVVHCDVHVRRARSLTLVWVAPFFVGALAFACSTTTDRATTTSAPASTSTTQLEDVQVTPKSFRALKTMTPVRGFFVDNLIGDLDATLAVARSKDGGEYPPGTVLQLVPQEAMVKHRQGFNPTTNDWEFFFLDVSAGGTKIVTRGVEEVVNRFGGNCMACHSAADDKFDFVCEDDHGCAPLPIGDDIIRAVQNADPRTSAG